MLKAVIFDFDGTLANTEKYQMRKWNIILKQFDIEISKDEYCRNYCGKSSTTTIPELLKEKYPQISYSAAEVADYASAELQKQFAGNRIELMPGSEDIIKLLNQKNIKYAVCSAKDQGELLTKLKNSGTTEWFNEEYRVTQAEAGNKGKPEPDMYLEAFRLLDISEKEVVVFEDTESGVLSASRAGLKVIALPTEYTKYHDFSKADYVVRNGWPEFLENYESILKKIDRSL